MKERYISLSEAGEKLGVVRGTLRYYLKQLGIERKKFPLDKRAYIKLEDFERIRTYKQEALDRQSEQSDTAKQPVLNIVAPRISLKAKPWIAGEDKRG